MAEAQDPAGKDFTAQAAALALAASGGTLATLRDAAPGLPMPHASLVTPAFLADGAPVLLLSTLSMHTRHLAAAPRCGLLLTAPGAADGNPQLIARLSLEGEAAPVLGAALPAAKARYLASHPYAAAYAEFGDFGFWRIEVSGAWFVGGFGAAARLDPDQLKRQVADRVAAVDASPPPA